MKRFLLVNLVKLSLLILIPYIVSTQALYNKTFDFNYLRSSSELLYEDNEYYYSIGYTQLFEGPEIGVQVSCHDKETGELCHSTYFEVEDLWLFTSGRTPVYHINENLVFGMGGHGTIYKLAYDITHKQIYVLDTIKNRLPTGIYLNDMLIKGDTTIYYITAYQNESNLISVITTFPDGRKKFIYLLYEEGYHFAGGKMIEKASGNFIIFGSKIKKDLKSKQIFFSEIDTSGNMISQVLSPISDLSGRISDLEIVNENEILVLAVSTTAPTTFTNYFFNMVYKYNHTEKKILWKYKLVDFPTEYFSHQGEIIKGHKQGEYLYCTSINNPNYAVDSFYTSGRIVKIRDNGSKVWHKNYSFYTGRYNFNFFIAMMPTKDGNYLIGGECNKINSESWLVKIDEDGNIIPIDTTSDTGITDITDISIYPNPAHDQIIINQGERTDMGYTIFDSLGRIELTKSIPEPHHNMVWDISKLPAGIYFLSITHQGKLIKSVKMVVE